MCIPHEEHTEAEAEPSPRGSQGHKRTVPTNSDSKQPTRLATQKYVFRPVSSKNSQNVPQTGRLKYFIPAWERIELTLISILFLSEWSLHGTLCL